MITRRVLKVLMTLLGVVGGVLVGYEQGSLSFGLILGIVFGGFFLGMTSLIYYFFEKMIEEEIKKRENKR